MRTYQTTVEINYQETARFFEGRGRRMAEVGPLGAVLYQDRRPELAARRSAHELARVAPLLTMGRAGLSVLDVGCGTGRWASALEHALRGYHGLDFCSEFLDEARSSTQSLSDPARFHFERADLSQGLPDSVRHDGFDAVVMAGVLLYLNDSDAHRLLAQVGERLRRGGVVYLREPLGVEHRLTLSSHYSDELAAEYSSVYRSRTEFESMLADVARSSGMEIRESDGLYPPELDNRSDTRQFFYLLDKV